MVAIGKKKKINVLLWVWGTSDNKQSNHEQILGKERIYSDTDTEYSWHQTVQPITHLAYVRREANKLVNNCENSQFLILHEEDHERIASSILKAYVLGQVGLIV